MSTQPLVKLIADNQVKDEAKKLFEQMTSSSGKVPKWMRVMANCDDILLGFFALFKATMDDAPLQKALKWKIAHIVSDLNKCEYCVSIAKMQFKTLGISDEEISKLEENLGEKEKIAVEYAKQATLNAYKIDPEVIEKLKATYTDEEIVELTSVVGLFNFINRFNDALRVFPD